MDTHNPDQKTSPSSIYLYPCTQKPDHLERLVEVPEGTYSQLMEWLRTTTIPERILDQYKGNEHEARLGMLTEAGNLKQQLDLCTTPDVVEQISQVFPDGVPFNLKREQLIPFWQLYSLLVYGWGEVTDQGWKVIQDLGLGEPHSPGECEDRTEVVLILYNCGVSINALKRVSLMEGIIWRSPSSTLLSGDEEPVAEPEIEEFSVPLPGIDPDADEQTTYSH